MKTVFWRGLHRARRYTWAHRATPALFLLVLVLGRSESFPWASGSLTSTRFFEVIPFADPLSALEVTLASRDVTMTLLIGAALVVVLWAFLGRAFCGWLCPLGLVLDLNDDVRRWLDRKLRRRGHRLPALTIPRETKYWLLGLCLMLSAVAALPVFTTVSPVNIVALAFVFSPGVELALIGGLVALEYVAPRAFCRSLCPLGAFHALIGRFGLLRVRVDLEHGEERLCRQCTLHCPMGIEVIDDHVLAGRQAVDDAECTRCGTCADVCLGDVLHLGFPPRKKAESAPAPERAARPSVVTRRPGVRPAGSTAKGHAIE